MLEFIQTNKKIAEAFDFMVLAHHGQKYGDMPYFTHPLAVAEQLIEEFPEASEEEIIAALLHDVVEDTEFGLKEIQVDYGADIAFLVAGCTKDETLTYEQNIQLVCDSGSVGLMRVKLSDNRVNYRGDKSDMKPARRNRLLAQYEMSIKMLEEALQHTTMLEEALN